MAFRVNPPARFTSSCGLRPSRHRSFNATSTAVKETFKALLVASTTIDSKFAIASFNGLSAYRKEAKPYRPTCRVETSDSDHDFSSHLDRFWACAKLFGGILHRICHLNDHESLVFSFRSAWLPSS